MRFLGISNSRLFIQLMRASMWVRFVVTTILFIGVTAIWWFVFYQNLVYKGIALAKEINLLIEKEEQLSVVAQEYHSLKSEVGSLRGDYRNILFSEQSDLDFNRRLIDIADDSGLRFLLYEKGKDKEGGAHSKKKFKFKGSFDSLLSFLQNLDLSGYKFKYDRLRVVSKGSELQITYVCGIPTFIKQKTKIID